MEPIIHDLNYKQFVTDPTIDGQKKKRGLIPRDYKQHPVGCYGAALPYHAVDFPLIPRSEWAERIKDMEAQKSRLSDIILDKQVPCTDQGNRGYCWIHSGTGALMALRASMNQPTVALSAYAGACIIKNYRDEGGWGAQGLDFIMSRGIPSEQFWPQRSVDRSNDNPQTWADAAKYKVTEGFIDLAAAQYDRNMSFEQEGTCLLICIPVIKDENWWGHSIYGCDLVNGVSLRSTMRADSGKLFTLKQFDKIWDVDGVGAGFGVRIRNSWGSRWGDNGFGILAGSKAISDGATAPRAALAA